MAALMLAVFTVSVGFGVMLPLLPDLILGAVVDETILDPQGRDLTENDVRWSGGRRAVRLDTGAGRVDFSDGTEERYDALLIATGGKPDVPAPLRISVPASTAVGPLPSIPRHHWAPSMWCAPQSVILPPLYSYHQRNP